MSRTSKALMGKAMFLHCLKCKGKTLTVEKRLTGTPDEYRQFFVNGRPVGEASKGERPNWDAMLSIS